MNDFPQNMDFTRIYRLNYKSQRAIYSQCTQYTPQCQVLDFNDYWVDCHETDINGV